MININPEIIFNSLIVLLMILSFWNSIEMRIISQKMADLNENNTKISLIPIMKDVIQCLDNAARVNFRSSNKQESNINNFFKQLPPIFFYFDKKDMVFVKINELYTLLWKNCESIAIRESLFNPIGILLDEKYSEYEQLTKKIREQHKKIISIIKFLQKEIINRYKIEIHS